MVRLTDRPDMILDVYHGHKTTIQQEHRIFLTQIQNEVSNNGIGEEYHYILYCKSGKPNMIIKL